MKKTDIPEDVLDYFKKQGAKGGRTRAARYTQAQLSAMGKKGGRPKGSTKKATKKGATK